MPTGPMMLDATAMEPATSLVSAQISPMTVPTTSTATITASQYKIRRLLMASRVLRQTAVSNVRLSGVPRLSGHRPSPRVLGVRLRPLQIVWRARDSHGVRVTDPAPRYSSHSSGVGPSISSSAPCSAAIARARVSVIKPRSCSLSSLASSSKCR